MRRIFILLFFVVVMAVWCTPSFAIPQDINPTDNLGALGVTDGAAMINQGGGGTLTVGSQDIFTLNSGLTLGTAVSTDVANKSNILFNGNSTVYGTIGTTGNYFKSIHIAPGATVNFMDTVFVANLANSIIVGTGAANFNKGTTNIGAIDFDGDGTVSLAANTFITGAITTDTASTGTLSLADGSKVVGAVTGLKAINVTGGSDTAGVVGTVNGAATQIKNFSLLTNELNITGGILTIATDGIINTRIASTSLYGHILVQDGYASNLGTGLQVVVTVPSGVLIPLGTLFDIVQSTSGTGALATVDYAAANGYEFTVATSSAGDAVLLTSKVGGAQALVPVAAPLAALVASAASSPDLLGVLGNINALSGSAQDNANAQLAPSTPSLAAPLVTFQGAREFQNLWLSRLDVCGQVSWPSEDKTNCKDTDARSGWWLKGFGYFGEQDARSASTGYNSQVIGSMIAYDEPIGLNTRMGVGIGYARSAIKGKTLDARTDFDTYQATAYIGHDQGPFFVQGSASFGWNEYSDKRHIQFTGEDRRANAKYSGQDYTAFARTGFHIPVPMKFIITPLASLQYSRVNIDSYTEDGANDLNLKVESQGYNFLESGLGAKLERDFSIRNWALVPEVRFEWLHMISNPKLSQNAAYMPAGSEYTRTYGLKTVADTYHAGTGLTLLSCACSATRWSLEGGYDFYWRVDGYSANQITARVTARF